MSRSRFSPGPRYREEQRRARLRDREVSRELRIVLAEYEDASRWSSTALYRTRLYYDDTAAEIEAKYTHHRRPRRKRPQKVAVVVKLLAPGPSVTFDVCGVTVRERA